MYFNCSDAPPNKQPLHIFLASLAFYDGSYALSLLYAYGNRIAEVPECIDINVCTLFYCNKSLTKLDDGSENG